MTEILTQAILNAGEKICWNLQGCWCSLSRWPMYKTRNTGTREWGECYILGNVVKYSGKCSQTFWEILPYFPGYVHKNCEYWQKIFWGMSPNIPGEVFKHSGKLTQKFRGILPNILGNVGKHYEECPQTFTVAYKWYCKKLESQSQQCGLSFVRSFYFILLFAVDLTLAKKCTLDGKIL